MKATIGQAYRKLMKRAIPALLLGVALATLWAATASAAVSVSAFDATGAPGQITLSWSTVTELKNFGFNVERSTTPSNANSWAKIAFVPSQSPCVQSMSPLTYEYSDSNLPLGTTYYYRLQLYGSPCGDPNVIHDVVVSAVSGDLTAPTATATAVPPTATRTVAPTSTATAVSTATSTPLPPTASPTTVPPTSTALPPTAVPPANVKTVTPLPAVATPTSAPAAPSATPEPVDVDSTATPEPTITIVAMVVPTTEASAPRANPPAQRKPTPTEAPAASSPSPALVGVGLAAVLGMGAFGFLMLGVAGVVLWQYYLRR
ncbi:MAG: hypothetical protein HZB53_13740 [Chloroflexi bacterium]|nr:hypothetical protein [Chloroflexota bacterium]